MIDIRESLHKAAKTSLTLMLIILQWFAPFLSFPFCLLSATSQESIKSAHQYLFSASHWKEAESAMVRLSHRVEQVLAKNEEMRGFDYER